VSGTKPPTERLAARREARVAAAIRAPAADPAPAERAARAAAPAQEEGAIRFAYGLAPSSGDLLPRHTFVELRAWRRICRRLGILGRDPRRYDGLGFGNLSVRDPADPTRFVITASQTGGARDLRAADLVRINECNLARFWVDAAGRKPPSSETLTHAMVYAADPAITWVFHVHAPELWRNSARLGLPCTAPEVPYGSRQMADAVAALARAYPARPLVFATLGHEDGVFACGADARGTGLALVARLAEALSD
jgi:hypothetical protein